MQTVTDRRTFVRNVVVGIPVVAGMASMSHVLDARPAHGAPLEPTLDSMLRDLARLHNQLRRRSPTQDDVRALAAHMRSLAAYQVGSNRDAEFTRTVREAIGRHGVEALAAHPADLDKMRHELVAFGFNAPLVSTAVIDTNARADALQRVARSGLAPVFSETGDVYANFDVIFLTAGPSSCDTLIEMHKTMEVVAAVTCSLATVVPALAPDCFAAATVLAALKLLMFMKGC
jgi:hypothetical protein